jgi:hypothetical protein
MSAPTYVHFQTLRERVASHPHTPIFKLPKEGALGKEWVDVSYTQFQADIERMARYWLGQLAPHNIPTRSVVGIWCVAKSSIAFHRAHPASRGEGSVDSPTQMS